MRKRFEFRKVNAKGRKDHPTRADAQSKLTGISPAPRGRRSLSAAMAVGAPHGVAPGKVLIRQALPLFLVLGLVVLMWDRIARLDILFIQSSLASVAPWQWFAALAFTTISFWALGRYDCVVHRLAGTGVRDRDAERAGITAIALSQTVGMGILSSAFVRWRMLPDLTLTQAMRISIIVSVSFLLAWAVLSALVVLYDPISPGWSIWGAAITLAAAVSAVFVSIAQPKQLQFMNIPPLRAMMAFLSLACLDTAAASAALWVLLPHGCDISWMPLLCAYLFALGAGLISGTPGGIGGFELTLISTLSVVSPDVAQEPILAAVLAFRAVYYALPAGIAALLTICGPVEGQASTSVSTPRVVTFRSPQLPTHVACRLADTPRADTNLLRHGRLGLIDGGSADNWIMGAESGQSLISVSDPMNRTPDRQSVLSTLRTLARNSYRTPILYRIGARLAVAARKMGWTVLPVAREAWLNPQSFTLDGADKRQLRRKLRQADRLGVMVHEAGADLPLKDMSAIAARWVEKRGGERGFSMGVWDPDTLPFSNVYLAYRQGELVGFMTLHANKNEQTLDLMRPDVSAPDGTMQALVTTAIAAAKNEDVKRFSLASVPMDDRPSEPRPLRYLRGCLDLQCGAYGLRQFKSAFGPNWETLYAAAPSRLSLALGLADVAREIHRPR